MKARIDYTNVPAASFDLVTAGRAGGVVSRLGIGLGACQPPLNEQGSLP